LLSLLGRGGDRGTRQRGDAAASALWSAPIPVVLGEVLVPDAQWYGVEEGQLCDGRKAIIQVMSRNLAGRLRGTPKARQARKGRRSLAMRSWKTIPHVPSGLGM
jgi:hypothetical protein